MQQVVGDTEAKYQSIVGGLQQVFSTLQERQERSTVGGVLKSRTSTRTALDLKVTPSWLYTPYACGLRCRVA
jgi:hypothetical protein